ncbi:hypothetical protein DFH09DRAFT_1354691 [Mycena vulgaris]|nr:hypothetical protein DFH09DRAFT_1354691 [Mycena vulgaris]
MLNKVLFAILGMVMVQGVVGVPQLVPCGASGDASCILPQACCDFSTIDPSLGFFHRLAAERKVTAKPRPPPKRKPSVAAQKRQAKELSRWQVEAKTEKEKADKKRAKRKGKAAPKATYMEVYVVVSDTKLSFPSSPPTTPTRMSAGPRTSTRWRGSCARSTPAQSQECALDYYYQTKPLNHRIQASFVALYDFIAG